ncbi:nuclease domain-containing protein [[Empedobacter] haloabium]|uniref:Nuclease domain-containing protein n=1 Tax=[Empedobacter] haloabium TaxID=592317 RepID=A0ABZ1UUP2_9BURK
MTLPTLVRRQPLRRTAFKRNTKPLADVRARAIKSSRPKMTPIRRAARGQDCTLQLLGVCNGDPATVVLCHSNSLADGKGFGLKAPDTAACFGCSDCHDVLDGRRPRPEGMTYDQVQDYFRHAVQRTHEVLRAKGLLA